MLLPITELDKIGQANKIEPSFSIYFLLNRCFHIEGRGGMLNISSEKDTLLSPRCKVFVHVLPFGFQNFTAGHPPTQMYVFYTASSCAGVSNKPR